MFLKFEQVQNEIEAICQSDNLELQYAKTNSFTNSYWNSLATAKFLLANLVPSPPIRNYQIVYESMLDSGATHTIIEELG